MPRDVVPIFAAPRARFRRLVHFAVIGKNHVRAIAEEKPAAHFDSGLFEIFEFGHERDRIHHRARVR